METNIKEWLRTSGYDHAVDRLNRMYSMPYKEAKRAVDEYMAANPEGEVYVVKPWSRVFLSTLIALAMIVLIGLIASATR